MEKRKAGAGKQLNVSEKVSVQNKAMEGIEMEQGDYMLRRMAGCFHTSVFVRQDDRLDYYEENPEYNPIFQSEELRLTLMRQADVQEAPVVLRDDFSVYYLCMKKEAGYYMMGLSAHRSWGGRNAIAFTAFMALRRNGRKDCTITR